MLHHPIIDKLEQLRFYGMANALRDQLAQPESDRLSFMERLGLMVDREASARANRALKLRLRRAHLHQAACIEDLDFCAPRGLDQRLMLDLASCDWIRQHLNVIITGPTGVGKSFIACALAHKACLEGFKARYHRLPRLLEELALARASGRYLQVLHTLSRLDVLVLDDWGLQSVTSAQQECLFQILDDRIQKRSTIATGQMPVEHWHETMPNPTLADAILDRLVQPAYRIKLKGESMRKRLLKTPAHTHQENP